MYRRRIIRENVDLGGELQAEHLGQLRASAVPGGMRIEINNLGELVPFSFKVPYSGGVRRVSDALREYLAISNQALTRARRFSTFDGVGLKGKLYQLPTRSDAQHLALLARTQR